MKFRKKNNQADLDIQVLKKEIDEIKKKYEDSSNLLLEELKSIDQLSYNQATELIALRSLLPKMTKENADRLADIIATESMEDKKLKDAAFQIQKVLQDPDIITNFLGKNHTKLTAKFDIQETNE